MIHLCLCEQTDEVVDVPVINTVNDLSVFTNQFNDHLDGV